MTDANDLLMGSGASTAKFSQIGTTISGTVLSEPVARQQTNFRTGLPETWPSDGSPKMMVVITLATADRDPTKPDDDGTRALYIKGREMTKAVRNAVRASGANGIHTGGKLTVQYTADGPAEAGQEPPKLYAAWYEPPAVSFNGTTPPTDQPQVTQYVPPAAPALPGVPGPSQFQQAPVQQSPIVASMSNDAPPAGVDQAMWARMDADQRAKVRAALSVPASAAGF